MVTDLLAKLLDLSSRRDGRDKLLQGLLECIGISDIEEQEVLVALGEAESLMSCQSLQLKSQEIWTYTTSPEEQAC